MKMMFRHENQIDPGHIAKQDFKFKNQMRSKVEVHTYVQSLD